MKILDRGSQKLKLPIYLKKNSELSFYIVYTPSASTYHVYDTLLIKTSDTSTGFKIICEGSSAHVDRSNVVTLKDLSLSKSKDKYLFIKGCASETDFHLTNSSGKKLSYMISGEGIKKISLRDLSTGKYTLEVYMSDCEIAGTIKLIITD